MINHKNIEVPKKKVIPNKDLEDVNESYSPQDKNMYNSIDDLAIKKSEFSLKVIKPSGSYIRYNREIQRVSCLDPPQIQEKSELLSSSIDQTYQSQSFDHWEGKAINLAENCRGKETKNMLRKFISPVQIHSKSKKLDQGAMTQSSNHSSKARANSLINSDLFFEIGESKF